MRLRNGSREVDPADVGSTNRYALIYRSERISSIARRYGIGSIRQSGESISARAVGRRCGAGGSAQAYRCPASACRGADSPRDTERRIILLCRSEIHSRNVCSVYGCAPACGCEGITRSTGGDYITSIAHSREREIS